MNFDRLRRIGLLSGTSLEQRYEYLAERLRPPAPCRRILPI